MNTDLALGANWKALLANHATFLRILILLIIFATGSLEGFLAPRNRGLACATWFGGLAALTIWIVYPLNMVRIVLGALVFVSGLILMILYYRAQGSKSK